MSGEFGAFTGSFIDIEARANPGTVAAGFMRLWVNSNDANNLYAKDAAGNLIQITVGGALASGNAQYMWDYFVNGTGAIIPNYSVVRLISGTSNDGKIALSDNDEISEDSMLGITYGGAIAIGGTGKVIYAGKVPGAVTGLGLNSNTTIYMSATPGVFTSVAPDFAVSTVFQIGFTKGNDLYLRPVTLSELG